MKYIIIGLGNFGSSLSVQLTSMGHEVIGIDNEMGKVEHLKDKLTHVVCLDSTDINAVNTLPLANTDMVIVCIGEDQGANIMSTAIMKQLKVKHLVSRAINPLHQTVLEAMGVDEIVHPEEDSAIRFAKKLDIKGVIDSFELTPGFNIIEARVPQRYIGKTLEEVKFRKNYNVVVLTTIKEKQEKNLLGIEKTVTKTQGVASSQTLLEQDDIIVMYGAIEDIQKLLKNA